MIKAAFGIGLTLALSIWSAAGATDITGVGASAPEPLYRKWADAYASQAGGGAVRYMAIGSRGGLKQIKAGTVDFGASDAPLSVAELERAGLVQFPVVVSGVVPVVNLLGLMPGELKLDGPLMADIYLGRISHWDDPRLIALNPHVALPHAPIQVVHRMDGSGTTLAFTTYLALKSPDWASRIGSGLDVAWPKGAAGQGNAGVAALVSNTPGAIGYLSFPFARESHLSPAQLPSASGAFVSPDLKRFSRAAASADFARAPGLALSLIDAPGPSWPIVVPSYIIVPQHAATATTGSAVLKFFDWAFRAGDTAATGLDYVTLPAGTKALVRRTWATEITGPDGKPLYAPK
jgi:phosphate transport system substrate-binding protein